MFRCPFLRWHAPVRPRAVHPQAERAPQEQQQLTRTKMAWNKSAGSARRTAACHGTSKLALPPVFGRRKIVVRTCICDHKPLVGLQCALCAPEAPRAPEPWQMSPAIAPRFEREHRIHRMLRQAGSQCQRRQAHCPQFPPVGTNS